MESTTMWKVLFILAVLCTSCLDVTSKRQDGGWSSWSAFSRCTLPCAGGKQVRSRTCSNPFPLHGGRVCPGRYFELRPCNTRQCPVDGGWSSWSAFSRCAEETQVRSRTCTNPAPLHGGGICTGRNFEQRSCKTTAK